MASKICDTGLEGVISESRSVGFIITSCSCVSVGTITPSSVVEETIFGGVFLMCVSVSFVVSTSVGLSDSPIEIGRKRTCPCVRLLWYCTVLCIIYQYGYGVDKYCVSTFLHEGFCPCPFVEMNNCFIFYQFARSSQTLGSLALVGLRGSRGWSRLALWPRALALDLTSLYGIRVARTC
jgi:hypothetical protein